MLRLTEKFRLSLFCVLAFGLVHCGGGFDSSTPVGHSVVLDKTVVTDVTLENDADNDGVYVTCDSDDGDATNTSLLEGCDADGDGYVDTACTTYADDDGVFSEEQRLEIGVNCDLCPGSSLEQTDDNQDGVGDSCNPDISGADIDINAPIS